MSLGVFLCSRKVGFSLQLLHCIHLGGMKRDKVSVVAGADTEHEEILQTTTEFFFHDAKVQLKDFSNCFCVRLVLSVENTCPRYLVTVRTKMLFWARSLKPASLRHSEMSLMLIRWFSTVWVQWLLYRSTPPSRHFHVAVECFVVLKWLTSRKRLMHWKARKACVAVRTSLAHTRMRSFFDHASSAVSFRRPTLRQG